MDCEQNITRGDVARRKLAEESEALLPWISRADSHLPQLLITLACSLSATTALLGLEDDDLWTPEDRGILRKGWANEPGNAALPALNRCAACGSTKARHRGLAMGCPCSSAGYDFARTEGTWCERLTQIFIGEAWWSYMLCINQIRHLSFAFVPRSPAP